MDKVVEEFLDDFEIKFSVEQEFDEIYLYLIDDPNYFDDKDIDRMKSIKIVKKVRDFFCERIDIDRLRKKDYQDPEEAIEEISEGVINDLENYYGDNWKEKAKKELVKEVREWLSS